MKLTPTPIKENEFLQKNKSPRLKQFCCRILTNIKKKKKKKSTIYSIFSRKQKKTLFSSFNKTSIAMIPKQDKDSRRKLQINIPYEY